MQYSYVHKISTRDPSKNDSRPLWGHDPKVENHRYKIFTAEELRTTSIRKLRGREDKDVG